MNLYRSFLISHILLLCFFHQLETFGQENQMTISEIDSLNQLAFSKFLSNPDSTRLIANQTLNYSKKLNYREGAGKALNYIGMSHHIKGVHDSAKFYYDKSLLVFQEEQDDLNAAKILNNLALLSSDQEFYHLALDYNFRSMEIAMKSGKVDNIFNSYNNIGVTYEKIQDYSHALEFHQKALDLILATENHLENRFYYYALGNLGLINLNLKNYSEAEKQTLTAYNYFVRTEDNYGISTSANHLGEIYLNLGNYPEAEKFIQLAMESAEQISSVSMLSDAMLTMGIYYFQQGQYNKAEIQFRKVESLAKTNKFLKTEAEVYEYLSKIDAENRRFSDALKNFQQSSILKDSLTRLKLEKQIAEQTIRYDLSQKDSEISLLNKEKLVQQLELRKSITQRNLFLILIISSLLLLGISLYYQVIIRKVHRKLKFQHKKILTQNEKLTANKRKMRKMVEKRTAQLLKTQEISEARSRILSIAAHELKTPLASMKLNIESLLRYWDRIDEPTKKKKLFKFDNTITQLNEIVIDFLLSKKGELNQFDCKPELISFNNLIKPIIENISDATHHSHEIEIHNAKKDPFIYLDKKLSINIFNNLLKNAIKFSPGKNKVIVKTQTTENYFEVEIIDFGIGISEEDQAKIFTPFERGKNTQNIEGTGLGLNIVKSMMELHGGEISVKSTLNEGSTFTLKFPRKKNNTASYI